MSNTSNNKTANNKPTKSKDKDKLRVIVGEIGRDSKTGILGRGYSSDNGKTFHVTDTMYGRLYDPNDIEGIWNGGTADKVKKEVDSATAEIPAAVSAANSAVSAAESAVAASKVNSDAIAAQSEAISEAKAAMDSATAEIQQTAANAASDAAKIRADVAQVQSEVDTAKAANSASVEALKSDVSAAKQDLADVHDSLTKAQAAAEESQKAIDKSIAQINSDIEQDRKDIASAQQANADTAKQLDTYSKQAQDQSKTIKSIQDKQDGFTATLADVQGNVTQVSDKVDGLSASLKDAQDNVASVKAKADQLSATLTDHAKSIATLTASAKELSSTLEGADGRLSKVEQAAQTNSSTLSDVQDDLSQVKQDATTLTATLKDAQGNISTLQQKSDSVSAQLASAQGDIALLQTDVTGIKATLVSHEDDIHTLQADSKTLKDDMQDAQGDISTLKKTSTNITSELKDHAGRISKVEQTATTLSSDVSDQQGHLNKVEQKATGTEQTVANQQGQINTIETDVSGMHQTITGQGNQIANINVTLSGLSSKYEGVSGDLGKLKSSAMQDRGTVSSPDFNSLTQAGYYTVTNTSGGKNYPVANWGTLEVSGKDYLNQKYVGDNNSGTYTRQYNATTKSWTAWIKTANQNDVTALSNRITTNSTQITQNKQAIDLKADQSTVNNLSGEVSQAQAQLKVQADQISSKVTSTDVNSIVNGKGYATTSTVQSIVDQKAGTINESIAKIDTENKGTAKQVQQLTASLDGLQSTVADKADKSQITQLSDTLQTKVSTSDFNNLRKAVDLQTLDSADINNMKTNGHYFVHNLTNSPIAGWVYVDVTGNGADRIRQDVYQDNGSQHKYRRWFGDSWTAWSQGATESEITQLRDDINLRVKSGDLLSQFNLEAGRTLIQSNKIYLDADTVAFSGKAFIPAAAITSIDADKINAGVLNGVELRQINTNGRTIDIADGNIVISSNDSSSARITFVNDGNVTKAFDAKGNLETLDQQLMLFDFKRSDVNSLNPIPYFSVVNTGEIGSGDAKIQFDHSWINGNSWWTKAAGVTFGRTYDGTGGSGDYAEIYAKSFNQNSELSAKTRIEKLDKKVALDKIMQDDMYTYQYKSDVRDGSSKRYASFIIDNVNDVAKYREPVEFLSANRHGRDDGTQLAYLIAAFQYQHGVIAEMQKEIEELKQGTAEK